MRWHEYRRMINSRLKPLNIELIVTTRDYPDKGDIYTLIEKNFYEIIFNCLSKKTLEKKIRTLEWEAEKERSDVSVEIFS